MYPKNMNTWLVLDIKSDMPTVDYAIKQMQIDLDIAKKSGVKAVKIIHGYGSHGSGGAIALACSKYFSQLVKKKKIVLISGVEWNLTNRKTIELLNECKDCCCDEDMNHSNPGISVIRFLD